MACLLVTAASAVGYLEPLQTRTIDLLQFLQGQRFPPEVAIVAIDDAAFTALGMRQPLARQYLARAIRGIQRSGAAALGIDVSLTVPTTPADDAALVAAIADFQHDGQRRVVLVEGPLPESGPLADTAFREDVIRGSDRLPVDGDGVIRRVAILVPTADGVPVPAFAASVLAALDPAPRPLLAPQAAGRSASIALPMWRDGRWQPAGPPLPFRAGELWRINFVGPEKSVLTIPSDAVAALADPSIAVASDNPLRGRIVLLGATFRDSRDFFQTPHGRLPGVEIHANVVHMVASRRLLQPTGWLVSLGIGLLVVLLAGAILAVLRPFPGSVLAVVLTVVGGVPASYLAFQTVGFAVDFVLPVLVAIGVGLVAHGIERRRVHASFGRYVGRDVLAQILAESPSLSGERREVSVLMSDIRGFTTLSEKLPAESVAAQLNDYFPAMVDAIFAHRGTVDDFIGDGILVVFGAPLPDHHHAVQAVRSAVAMQAALRRLNASWESRNLPTLRMGIGIHTGVVFAGNVGSADRVKYTVIGDTVNTAARLEGLNKDLGTEILLTEETRKAIGDLIETRYLGEVAVKGRAEALRVHELLRLRDGMPPDGGSAS